MMKTIGLIGGMSWESTVVYYQLLNRLARERLGGLHSAKLLMFSFDFAEVEAMQAKGDWAAATEAMISAAKQLEAGGADCIVIATNTMHKMAPEIANAVTLPLLHIADATAGAIKASPSKRPLLLATRYTMEQDFYKGWLKDKHGIEAVVPNEADREIVHRIIYEELCQGIIKPASKAAYLEVVARNVEADPATNAATGADGVIFGCTEVGLLVQAEDFAVPSFDTTALHAAAAMDFALSS